MWPARASPRLEPVLVTHGSQSVFLSDLGDSRAGLAFPAVVISTGSSGWERERFSRSFLPLDAGSCCSPPFPSSRLQQTRASPGGGKLRGATHLRLAFGGGGQDGPLSGVDCEEAKCRGGTAGTEEVTNSPQ